MCMRKEIIYLNDGRKKDAMLKHPIKHTEKEDRGSKQNKSEPFAGTKKMRKYNWYCDNKDYLYCFLFQIPLLFPISKSCTQ
jgi:hypothetical protein